jgi:hypothetical protein
MRSCTRSAGQVQTPQTPLGADDADFLACQHLNRKQTTPLAVAIPPSSQSCSAAYPAPAQASRANSGAFAALVIGGVGGGIALIVLAVAAVAVVRRYRRTSDDARGTGASEAVAAAPRMRPRADPRALETNNEAVPSAPPLYPVCEWAQPDGEAFAGGRTARDLVVADVEGVGEEEPHEATSRSPPAGGPQRSQGAHAAAPQPAAGEQRPRRVAAVAAAAEAAGTVPRSAGRRQQQARATHGAAAASSVEVRSDGLLLGRLQQWLRSLLAPAPPGPSGNAQKARRKTVQGAMRAGSAGAAPDRASTHSATASAPAAVSANPLHAALSSGGGYRSNTADCTRSDAATAEAADAAGVGLAVGVERAEHATSGAPHRTSRLRRRSSIGSTAGGTSTVVVVQVPSPLRQVREQVCSPCQLQQRLQQRHHESHHTPDAHEAIGTDIPPLASPTAVAITVEGCDAVSPLHAVALAAASRDADAAPPLRVQRNTAQGRTHSRSDSVVWVASPGRGALKAASVTLPRLRSFARPLPPVQQNPLTLLPPTAGAPPPSVHGGAAGMAALRAAPPPLPQPPGVPLSPQYPAPAPAPSLAPAPASSARSIVRALALSARPPRASGSAVPAQAAEPAALTAATQRVSLGRGEATVLSRNPLSTPSETTSAAAAAHRIGEVGAAASNPLSSAASGNTSQASGAVSAYGSSSSSSSRRLHNPLHGMLPPEAPVVAPLLAAANGSDAPVAATSAPLRIQNPLRALLRRVGPGHTAGVPSARYVRSGFATPEAAGDVTARGAGSMPSPPTSPRAVPLTAAAADAPAHGAGSAPDARAGALADAPS